MSTSLASAPSASMPASASDALVREVEQFFYFEAALLDERKFDDWLMLLAPDIHYHMPGRYLRSFRDRDQELGGDDTLATFDDDFGSLRHRVRRLGTGMAWAEEPASFTRHLITNVRVAPQRTSGGYDVESNFIVYRSRGTDVSIWSGQRQDILRRIEPRRWQIAKRRIVIDQSTLMSNSLSVFF